MTNRLKRLSLTEQASDAIIELISERGLRPGDLLPPTSELAAEFNVSVPVVREAVAGLSSIGLLRKQQGRESIVSTPGPSHLGRLLGLRISSERIDDVATQQYREIIEVGNARLAARGRTANSIAKLEKALQNLRLVDSEETLHEADVAFHAAVAEAGGNDLIMLTLDALQPLLRRQREHVWKGWVASGGDLDAIIEAHAQILEAIRAGDEEEAGRAMGLHLTQARAGLEYAQRIRDRSPAPEEPLSPFKVSTNREPSRRE